ncbi:MAG: 16S rRNA (guanine(966)-N(2))-methyltransferase RsmD [Actinomycetota bacterium]|nr:16S rRNA (guanine(966)-N(2))-methyltransferase RsmD [Actinomycetota bacterium]
MIRIIGGTAGGRRLKSPTGESTRPTSDRVREALFSALEASAGSISGLHFLDLYAGSGAVALEALSRGAAAATCVEHDRRTAALIRENARSLGLPLDVVTASVARVLSQPPRAPYDIAFLDPPYSLPTDELVANLTAARANGWLGAAASAVLERSSRSRDPVWPDGFVADRAKKYGETTLWYGHAATPEGTGSTAS